MKKQIFVIILVIIFSSCNKQKNFIGTWEIYNYEIEELDNQPSNDTMNYSMNGTCIITKSEKFNELELEMDYNLLFQDTFINLKFLDIKAKVKTDDRADLYDSITSISIYNGEEIIEKMKIESGSGINLVEENEMNIEYYLYDKYAGRFRWVFYLKR